MQAGHVRAAGIAYETTSGDRDYARPVAAGHPVLAQVSERIPGELIERHWDPVVSVADALIAAPVYILDAAQVIAVAGLRDIELSWDQLCDIARAVHPDNPGLEAYPDWCWPPGRRPPPRLP